MRTRLINFWETLRSTYWFLPTLMAAMAVVLVFVTLRIDFFLVYEGIELFDWNYMSGPEGARTLLSTIAGSMITVAGVTFSITIVALTLASSQFGPRLLSNFMRDMGNQIVLGTFIATYIYCLLILSTIRGGDEPDLFVPPISITVGLLLALASLGVLIYFIHHASISIHVESVISAVDKDLDEAIERLFPQEKRIYSFDRALREEDDIPENFEQDAYPVTANQGGYLQAVDQEGLMTIALENDLLLRLAYRPGDFIAQENELVKVWSDEIIDVDEQLFERLNDAFILGAQRLSLQDVEYSINQLVEIAVRALSPGINDPFTAMACLDRLGAALSRLAKRTIPSAYHYDDNNKLRIIRKSVTFAGILDAAFNQIRRYGRSSPAVTVRLLETIAVIGAHTHIKADLEALRRHALSIKRSSYKTKLEFRDRQAIEAQYQIVLNVLEP